MQSKRASTLVDLAGLYDQDFFAWTRRSAGLLRAGLLKWWLQPGERSRSWERSIAGQRIEIDQVLEDSPSLRTRVQSGLPRNYEKSVQLAAIETALPHSKFPTECPFTVEQILDPEFLP